MNAALRLLRNISSNYARAGVEGVILIVLTPLIVQTLGPAVYAVWVIVQTLAYYLGFLDLGVADAQVQRHSLLLAQGRGRDLGRLHGTVLMFFLGAGVVAVAIAALLAALPTGSLFDVPVEVRESYALALLLAGFAVLVSFAGSALNGLYEGYQRYDLLNAVGIAVAVVEAVVIYAVLAAGYGLVGLALVKLGGEALRAVAKLAVAARAFPRDALPRLRFDLETWRSIRSYSLWNSLNDIVTEGTAHLDKLLIPILLASALVTPYSLVVMLAAVIFLVAEPITEPYFPLAASRHGKRDAVAMGMLLVRGTKLVNVATLPTLAVVLCFGDAILDLWIGPEYTDVAPAVLWLTAVNFYMSTHSWTALAVLLGTAHVRQVFWTSVIEVGSVLVLILLLVPQLGLTGLALAALIGNVTVGLAGIVARACRLAEVALWPFLRTTLLRPAAAAAPGLVLGVWLAREVALDTWLVVAVGAAAVGLVTFVGVAAVSTSRWERARYFAAARRLATLAGVRSG